MTSELLSVIGTMVGSKEIVDMSNNKEVEDMCTALEKLKQEGIKEGIEKGVKAMLSKEYAVSEISELFDISEEEVLKIKENFFDTTRLGI